jgi:hypothetical protein
VAYGFATSALKSGPTLLETVSNLCKTHHFALGYRRSPCTASGDPLQERISLAFHGNPSQLTLAWALSSWHGIDPLAKRGHNTAAGNLIRYDSPSPKKRFLPYVLFVDSGKQSALGMHVAAISFRGSSHHITQRNLQVILIDPWSYRIHGSRLPKPARQWLSRCLSVAFGESNKLFLLLEAKLRLALCRRSSVSQ